MAKVQIGSSNAVPPDPRMTDLDEGHEYRQSDDNFSSADEYDDAVLMIQPDETSGHKALRRLVDKIFVGRENFRLTSVAYEDMQADEDGVSVQLRCMLFPPSRQVKRRGKRRYRTDPIENGEDRNHVNKEVQRQSKQKERCENKLMSLLFATVYDHATKRCRLVGQVPPLKLVKKDKKGQCRNVSNYTEVRAYLRHKMSIILAGHVSAVKTLTYMLPSIFDALPAMFMTLSRTFLVLHAIENGEDEFVRQGTETGASEESRRMNAQTSLDVCTSFVQEYLDEWGRRSYTTDNPLRHFRRAGVHDDCYKAVFKLLRSMIAILPPPASFPRHKESRKTYLYSLSLSEGRRCESTEKCSLQSLCPGNSPLLPSDLRLYHEFVRDLCHATSICDAMDFSMVDSELRDPEFPPAVWRTCISNIDLHTLKDISEELESHSNGNDAAMASMKYEFVRRVTYEIAKCWAALSRSNSKHLAIVESLEIEEKQDLRETIVELVYGGGIAATAIFEREEEIRPISEKLRGRKTRSYISSVNARRVRHSIKTTTFPDADRDIAGEGHRESSEEYEDAGITVSPDHTTRHVREDAENDRPNHLRELEKAQSNHENEELVSQERGELSRGEGGRGKRNATSIHQINQNNEIEPIIAEKSRKGNGNSSTVRRRSTPTRSFHPGNSETVSGNQRDEVDRSIASTEEENEENVHSYPTKLIVSATESVEKGAAVEENHESAMEQGRHRRKTRSYQRTVNEPQQHAALIRVPKIRERRSSLNTSSQPAEDVGIQVQDKEGEIRHESPMVKRKNKPKTQVKKKRRGTITQTLEEANLPTATRSRLRKKARKQ